MPEMLNRLKLMQKTISNKKIQAADMIGRKTKIFLIILSRIIDRVGGSKTHLTAFLFVYSVLQVFLSETFAKPTFFSFFILNFVAIFFI